MNLPDLFNEFGVPFASAGHRHVSAGWIGTKCVSCGSDDFHLGWSLGSFRCSCWRCGSLPPAKTLMELTGQPWRVLQPFVGDLESKDKEFKPRGKLKIPAGVGSMLQCHRRYLRSRGFDPAALERDWGVQGIGLAPRLAWRLFLPIRHRGQVASWTTRALHDGGLRYVSAKPEEEAVPAKSILAGADKARHAIIVVEGLFNVYRIGPGACATLGTGFSRAQVLAASAFPVRAICFDAEPEAQARAKAFCSALEPFGGRTYRAELSTGNDPADADESEIRHLRREFLR